ncbi:MAG: energy transducer TonB [Candidatus Ratteibacteria bacterium]|nr:energy transducer TonB [Candidatus Ratteibacteria bacterium]
MIWKQNLLLKAFIFSLLLHITGISLFSLVLPLSKSEMEPIEVSLLPISSAPAEPTTEVRNISLEIPRSYALGREKITIETKKEVLRFSPQETTGLSKIITPPEILSTIGELPEVKIPEIIPFGMVGSGNEKKVSASDIEIEGPAGGRALIYKEPIEYPGWAIEKGLEGNIRIKFWVAPDGKIVLTNLITSSGYPELDLYTEQQFRRWMFEPVKTDKQAWGLITFRFQLR